MPRNDLDDHFHRHPKLRKYAEMFDAQEPRALRNSQRLAWISLALLALVACYVLAAKTHSWSPLVWFSKK